MGNEHDSAHIPTDAPAGSSGGQTGEHVSQQALGDKDALSIIRKTDNAAATTPLTEVKLTDSPAQPLSREQVEKIAAAIDKAANGGVLGIGTDVPEINRQLEKLRTKEDRDLLDEIYRQKYGDEDFGIEAELRDEMSGTDLSKALRIWNAAGEKSADQTVAPAAATTQEATLARSAAAPAEAAAASQHDTGPAESVAPNGGEQHKPLNSEQLQAMAEAIDNAANGGLLGLGTDKEAINEQLKLLKTPEERTRLDELYRQRTGHGIEDELEDELSGSDLARSMELWKGSGTDVSRVYVGLIEHKEWGIGARSNEIIEKDLRDTISTLNSTQIEELDRDYRQAHGVGISDALLQDENLPESTRQALEIYLKGTDKRTPEDTAKLAEISLSAGNLDMFEETFRDASPEARTKFLENNGEAKIMSAFGTVVDDGTGMGTTYLANEDTRHALEYARIGKLSAATRIGDNTGIFNDNEEAIELTLKSLRPEERRSYLEGKRLAESGSTDLSQGQKDDLDYYNRLHSAMKGAGNDREMAKWEDMIANPDGSLVGKLAEHGGIIDDSVGDVLETIEDMSEEDWKKLKQSPEHRREIERVLAADLSDSEMARARELLDRKAGAETFEASRTVQRSVTDAIDDQTGIFNDDEEGVLEAIKRMTPEERDRYRQDEDFRKKVDEGVRSAMDEGSEQKAAFALLDSIKRNENPEDSVIARIHEQATHMNTDEAVVIADLEKALRKPEVKERLANDPAFRAELDEALHAALDPDEYDRYARPLMEGGRLPFKVKAELYQGVFDDNEKGLYEALQNASPEDGAEIKADPDGVLPFLSEEERKVALNIVEQNGEMRPEDKLRASILGVGADSAEIKKVLSELSPEQTEQVAEAYRIKYGSDLRGDLIDETGGDDRMVVESEMRAEPLSDREAFNEARDRVYESVDGIGRSVVDAMDGTGDMTMDDLNQYAAGMAKYSAAYEEMPAEQRQQYQEQLGEALKLYQESESAAADMLVDGTIIAAGVAGASFTGGVSLSLLAYTSVGGALFKVGAKSAIMGNDYDFSGKQVLTDGASGAVEAATIFLGPAQAAQMLKIGGRTASTATRTIMAEADDIMLASGRQIFKEGAEEILERKTFEQVAFAISNGADEVSESAIKTIARSVANSADDVADVQRIITTSLNEAVRTEAANGTKAMLREVALNSASGNVGGGLSSGVYGAAEWDSSRSFEENIAVVGNSTLMGATTGTLMAGGMTIGLKGLMRGLGALGREADPPAGIVDDLLPGPAAQAEIANLADVPATRVVLPDQSLHDVGDLVQVNGQKAVLAGVDDSSGRAIVRYPEREGWAAKAIQVDDDLGKYQPVEIHGKSYLAAEDGTVYSYLDTGEGGMLLPRHEYQLAPSTASIESLAPDAPVAARTFASSAEEDLSKGHLRLDGDVHPESRRTEVYPGQMETADGRHIDVVFHAPEHTPEHQAARLQNEMAGHELSDIIGFDSRYPAAMESSATVNGRTVDGWVQESVGSSEALQDHLRTRTVERFGRVDRFDEDLPRLLNEDPALKSKLEEAIVQRLVYGDHDINLHNIAISEDGVVRNLDLGEAFTTDEIPELSTFRNSLLDVGLHKTFAGQEISDPLRQKLGNFARQFEDAGSQSELARKLNLSEDQVRAVVSRARQMAESGRFPDIDPKMIDPDNIDFWRAAARIEAEDSGLAARESVDGLRSMDAADGSNLKVDMDSGRLRSIDNERGGHVDLRYDQSGNLTEVVHPNGVRYATEDGVNWKVTDKDAPGGGYEIRGKMSAGEDGSISWHPEGGSLSVRHPDGSMIMHDSKGQIERIMAPDGRMSYLRFDTAGELRDVTLPNGLKYSTEDGLNWHVTDQTAPDGGYDIRASMTLSEKGDITWHPEGGDTTVRRPDGSGFVKDRDSGQVTRLLDADGNKTHIEYDGSGEIRKVTYPNGVVYSSADGTNWRVKDATAPDGGYDIRARMSVGDDGRIAWEPEPIALSAEARAADIPAAPVKSLEEMLRESDNGTLKRRVYDSGSGAYLEVDQGTSRIGAIDSQRGGRVELGYDEIGGVNDVTYPGGVRYRTEDGVTWHVTDNTHPDGGYDVRGSMAVSNDGRLAWHPEGGDLQVRNSDGSILKYDRRGGLLTEIVTPEGKTLGISRGPAGEVLEVKHPNGIVYSSQDGVTWRVTDATAPGGGYDIRGTMTLSDDGRLSWRPENGDTTIRHPDGSMVKQEGDAGRVLEIISPQGQKTRLGYDTNGEVREVAYPNGVVYRSLDGENWRVQDATHPEGAYNIRGRADVTADGDLHWQPEGGRSQTRRPDGTVHVAELETDLFAEGSFDSLNSGRGKRKLWGPQRDVQKMSSDERMQLFRDIEVVRSPLTNSEAADEFVESVLPRIEQWRDLTPLMKPLDAAKKRYDKAVTDYQILLDTTFDLPPQAYFDNNVAREFFKNSPEELKIVDEFLNARESRNLVSQHVEKHLQVRRDELQMALDEFADRHNLPHMEIKLREGEHMGASKASYSAGEITLNKEDLIKRDTGASLLGSLYHEAVHGEQDNTILRALADELGVKADYDAADINAVMAAYKSKVGRQADRDFVNRVLHKRSTLDEIALSEADRARVPDLIEAYKNNTPVGQAWLQSANDFRVTNGALKALQSDDPNAAIKLIVKINRGDGTSAAYNKHLFGTAEPPAEFADYYRNFKRFQNGDDDAWSPEISREARDRLRTLLSDRLDGLNETRRQAYERYMQLHEKDALLAGEWARLSAVQRGAGNSEQVAVDGVAWGDGEEEIDQLLRQLSAR